MKGRMQFVPAQALPMHHHADVTLPLRPPFVVVPQHQAAGYEEFTWKELEEAVRAQNVPGRLEGYLFLDWGTVVYQNDGNGGVEMAASYTDSSD